MNKIDLYMCEECETMVNHPQFFYDDDGPLCEKCFDEGLARGDAAYDSWKDEQLLKEFQK